LIEETNIIVDEHIYHHDYADFTPKEQSAQNIWDNTQEMYLEDNHTYSKFSDQKWIQKYNDALDPNDYNGRLEVNGSNCDPFLLCGSKIMTGSGKALVCAVGKNTRLA
jgi:magnesium-transporting ATPase (P-type)